MRAAGFVAIFFPPVPFRIAGGWWNPIKILIQSKRVLQVLKQPHLARMPAHARG
jgi:hypothetical protein